MLCSIESTGHVGDRCQWTVMGLPTGAVNSRHWPFWQSFGSVNEPVKKLSCLLGKAAFMLYEGGVKLDS